MCDALHNVTALMCPMQYDRLIWSDLCLLGKAF